jgi:hypothetical protein
MTSVYETAWLNVMMVFVGAFAILRKKTIRFVMSARPHATTRLPMDWFSWNLIFWVFFENLSRNFKRLLYMSKIKGHPATGRGGPTVPGRLKPRIILTFRHYKGGSSSAIRTGRLYPRINPWYSLSEAESTSGHMVLSGVPRKKSPVTPPGIDPGTVRLIAQRLNHYATPGPYIWHSRWNVYLHCRMLWDTLISYPDLCLCRLSW